MSSRPGLPTLASDGSTVVFSSLDHFRAHHEAYIRHGAILAAATPIDVGTRRHLTLRIDDLGFAVERFADHKEWLRAIAEEIE